MAITDPNVGTFTYTPNNGFVGTDSFTFYTSDTTTTSNTATETITVLPPLVLPIANNSIVTTDAGQSVTGTLSATNSTGSALTFAIATRPTNGTVSLIDSAAGTFSYVPAAGFGGQDSFTFEVGDDQGVSNIATETVVVYPPVNSNGDLYLIYDEQGRLLGEYDRNGHLRSEHIWLGGRSVGVETVGGVYYVQTDQNNVPRVVSDRLGRPVWQWNSEPFGSETPNQDPSQLGLQYTYNLRFAGQYFDTETGHDYNYMREYDPVTGRYIQSDPAGQLGGINSYAYAGGNPLHWDDADGLAYQVSQSGNVVTINATITIYGPNANINVASAWQDAINNTWNNFGNNFHFGTCQVVFDVTITVDPNDNWWFTALPADNYIYVTDLPADNSVDNSSKTSGMVDFLGSWNENESTQTISHEAGHLFDLWDHYERDPSDNTTTPWTGYENDIMGAMGQPPGQEDIDSIVSDNTCGCKN